MSGTRSFTLDGRMNVHAWSSAAPRRHDSTLGVFRALRRFPGSPPPGSVTHRSTDHETLRIHLARSRSAWSSSVATPVFAQAAPQAPSSATTNMEILAQKLKADKKLLVAQTVGLTDARGRRSGRSTTRIRPTCRRSMNGSGPGSRATATDYNAGTMTDAKAPPLTSEMIAIEEPSSR